MDLLTRYHQKWTRLLFLGVTGALLAASLAACGTDPTATPTATSAPQSPQTPTSTPGLIDRLYTAAQEEGEVVWATTDTEVTTTAMIAAFEQAYPGVRVNLITANTAGLTERLFLEAQAGRISVDVTDPGRDNKVLEQNLAEDLTDIVEELGIDPNLVYADNRIFLKVGVTHAPVCNTNRVSGDQFPQSYEDLLDPKFKGEIVVESRLKGFVYLTNLTEYGNSRPQLWDEERVTTFLSGMKANDLKAQRGNGVVGDLVASGEVSCALEMNLSSFTTLLEQGAPVALVPVAVHSVEPVFHFVPKGSPNPNAAKLFSAFLLGEEGRALWTKLRPTSDLTLGANSEYSRLVNSLGSVVVPPGIEMNDNFSRLTKKYLEAIGIPTG